MDETAQRSLRAAELLDLGVTKGELRGPRWRAPFRGVHTPVVEDIGTTLQRIHDAVALLPPGGVLGGWAAAYLHGATELDGRGRSGTAQDPVTLVVPLSCHLDDRPGIRYFRTRLADDDRADVDGLPVTGRIRTAFDLGRWSSAESAVVALDTIARQARVDPNAVIAYARAHPRLRRARLAGRAAGLADPLSRSAGESRYRYCWMVDAGLPRPVCNAYIVDAEGVVVACADLLDPDSGLCGEYDGSTHRELESHTEDNNREERLEDLGLVVVRSTNMDLWRANRPRTVQRMRRAHARARSAGPGRWGWYPSAAPVFW